MNARLELAWVRKDLLSLAAASSDPARAERLRKIARDASKDLPAPPLPAMPRDKARVARIAAAKAAAGVS